MNRIRSLILGAALLGAVVLPADAWAQACLGIPTSGRQAALQTGATFTDGARGYDLGVAYDTAGPLTILASAGFVDLEDTSTDAWSGAAGVAAEMPLASLSLCPTALAGYTRTETDEAFDARASLWTGNIGVSLGKAFQAESGLRFLPYVQPSLVVARVALEIAGEELKDTDEAFSMTAGANLSGARFFGGASVNATTFEDSDPSYGVHIGMTL